jgi:hypothetical protein
VKKFFIFLAFLSGIVWILTCSNDMATGSLADNYDHRDLFKVEFVGFVDSDHNFAMVKIYWLVSALGRGSLPFSCGPTDEDWNNNVHLLSEKTADGKYYVYSEVVRVDRSWTVGAGLHAANPVRSSNSGWLTPNQQGGNEYYNVEQGVMTFFVSGGGKIFAGN